MAKALPFTSTQNLSSKPMSHHGAGALPKEVPAAKDKREAKMLAGMTPSRV